MKLEIQGKSYEIEYTFNTMCDTDLLDKVEEAQNIFNEDGKSGLGKVKDLMKTVRNMFQIGLEEHNPVSDVKEVGKIIQGYMKDGTEENPHNVITLFELLSEAMGEAGFLAENEEQPQKQVKVPQDHLKPVK